VNAILDDRRDMRTTRKTSYYVHAGDRARGRRRTQRVLVAIGLCVASGSAWASRAPAVAHAEVAPIRRDEVAELRSELDATRGELDIAHARLERWGEIFDYSSRYRVGADLATSVYDVALAEGIEPDLGFRLVRAESEFNPRATSPVGAIGLTQVMPSTARYFEKGITRERLYDRETNLRIGFRYLRTLVREQKGNVRLALLVYNRGPVAVEASLRQGLDPSNGYDRGIMKGYKGRGVTD
jgi:soluble lytic murein transglycosylase-like protein